MDLFKQAELALEVLIAQGFEDAHVSTNQTYLDELNVEHDEPSLLRSSRQQQLKLIGLFDNRRASVELSDCKDETIRQAAATMFVNVQTSPQDAAHAVSEQQRCEIIKGPQTGDMDLLAAKVSELLKFRAEKSPKMHLSAAFCSYTHMLRREVTSRGTDLRARIGAYGLMACGLARDNTGSSSFDIAEGSCEDIAVLPATEWFGIGDMLRQTERQIRTQGIKGKFTGDVVFAPNAVASILTWLIGQLGDTQLISGSSIYMNRVGESIASSLLSIRSHFDGAGVYPITADAYQAKPFTLLESGSLQTLLPSLYGSGKTGIAHTPSLIDNWSIDAGSQPVNEMISNILQGALVNRLSMGMPGSNGDFSAVIKCSFLISDGEVGPALSEVMISGNMGELLQNVVGVSAERIDRGVNFLPWIRVAGLHFS